MLSSTATFFPHTNDSVELVFVVHVVDVITFWAQNVSQDKITENMDTVFLEMCLTAARLTGRPNTEVLWGMLLRGQMLVQVQSATAGRRQDEQMCK
ncbi:hypothetical protein MHYP_G00022130 [Metynnis hypsauchen]